MQNLSVAHSSHQGVGVGAPEALPAQHPPLHSHRKPGPWGEILLARWMGQRGGLEEGDTLSRVTQGGGPELHKDLGPHC